MTTVPCPICGDTMDCRLVACWFCYRASDRLTPDSQWWDRAHQQWNELSTDDITEYDRARDLRIDFATRAS